jgi:predicted phage terminase large subunit-like protein
VVKNYTDTADTGSDYLCSITYIETSVGNYVLDVIYTQKPMEYTEQAVAVALSRFGVEVANIESNNGGRGFARNVERILRENGNSKTYIKWFAQGKNKQSRIYTHSADVQNLVYFPQGWETLYPEFARDIKNYMKTGLNPHDDAPDALTGTVEFRPQKSNVRAADFF